MALINCPNCGQQISDKAVKCPHCDTYVTFSQAASSLSSSVSINKKWLILFLLSFGYIVFITADYYKMRLLVSPRSGDPAVATTCTFLTVCCVCAFILIFIKKIRRLFKSFFIISLIGAFVMHSYCIYHHVYYDEIVEKEEQRLFIETSKISGKVLQFTYENLDFKLVVTGEPVKSIYSNMDCELYVANRVYDACLHYYDDKRYGAYFYDDDVSYNVEFREPFDKIKVNGKTISLNKITEEQARLEEFKKFQTNDLAAFMLHGRVKKMTEHSGQIAYSYYFSEDGILTDVSLSEGNYRCKITRSGRKLTIIFENPNDPAGVWGNSYTVDNAGRLTECGYGSTDYSSTAKFSNYDENGWPTVASEHDNYTEYDNAEPETITYKYTKIDEYGNWLQSNIETREIEYYPIGK